MGFIEKLRHEFESKYKCKWYDEESDYRDFLEEHIRVGQVVVSGQNYNKVWELLKEARDEADAEGLERISCGIEALMELINHR